jgi:glycosyltransferase involved in cell wall biosynthesis
MKIANNQQRGLKTKLEVSVVIPLYNKGPYIARALNSVLSQTAQNFEVIVVDDGSTDDGADVVRGFGDPRIMLIQQENKGVSAARNRGIEAARANLIAFLDADDEWLPKHLETLMRLWERYPVAGAYGTAYLMKMKNLSVRVAPFSSEIPKGPWEGLLPNYFKAAAMGEPPISASTVAVSKCILNEMGGFNTEAWWAEDTDLWGRIALKYPIAFSWEGGGIYHLETSNRAGNRVEPVEENIFVSSALKALQAGKVPPELRDDLLEYIASKQILTACRNLQAGRPDLAKCNLMNCKTQYLWKSKYWALFWTYVPSRIYIALRNLKSRAMKNVGMG